MAIAKHKLAVVKNFNFNKCLLTSYLLKKQDVIPTLVLDKHPYFNIDLRSIIMITLIKYLTYYVP